MKNSGISLSSVGTIAAVAISNLVSQSVYAGNTVASCTFGMCANEIDKGIMAVPVEGLILKDMGQKSITLPSGNYSTMFEFIDDSKKLRIKTKVKDKVEVFQFNLGDSKYSTKDGDYTLPRGENLGQDVDLAISRMTTESDSPQKMGSQDCSMGFHIEYTPVYNTSPDGSEYVEYYAQTEVEDFGIQKILYHEHSVIVDYSIVFSGAGQTVLNGEHSKVDKLVDQVLENCHF